MPNVSAKPLTGTFSVTYELRAFNGIISEKKKGWFEGVEVIFEKAIWFKKSENCITKQKANLFMRKQLLVG